MIRTRRAALATPNRPERKNPLTFESHRELTDFFRAFEAFANKVKPVFQGN